MTTSLLPSSLQPIKLTTNSCPGIPAIPKSRKIETSVTQRCTVQHNAVAPNGFVSPKSPLPFIRVHLRLPQHRPLPKNKIPKNPGICHLGNHSRCATPQENGFVSQKSR